MAGLLRKCGIAVLLGLLAAGGALAAGDPTRPPAAWLNPDDLTPESAGAWRLQSVLIPQHGRPLAIIGGQTVHLGGRYGEQRLVRLNEREAVLRGEDGITRLYLTPDVEKRMVAPPKSRPVAKTRPAKDSP